MAGETTISTTDPRAIKHYSVSLHAEAMKKSVFATMLIGRKSSQHMALAKRQRQQTSHEMPLVRVTDLQKNRGDRVTIDMFHTVVGKPTMGDEKIEGRGVPLTFATMEAKINQSRFAIDAGSIMTQQRTSHNLRAIARANMASWFGRLNDQRTEVMVAGARGDENTEDWTLPLESEPDFKKIMINPVEPPTTNRYFVAGGGTQASDIGTTDALTLEDIDVIAATLRDMTFPPSPVQINGMEPVWCLFVTERQWHYIITRNKGEIGANWRKALADTSLRRAATKNHPLFTGETGYWNNILIKRAPRAIRFKSGTMVKTTNADTGAVQMSAAGATIDRAILLGGQALAILEGNGSGRGQDAFPMRWSEKMMDHGNSTEIAAAQMDGMKKFRFEGTDGKHTDFGVCVIDSYAPDMQSAAGAALRTALNS